MQTQIPLRNVPASPPRGAAVALDGRITNEAVVVQHPETGYELGLGNKNMQRGYFEAALVTQGDTSTPSVIKFSAKTVDGQRLLLPGNLLRIRACENDGLFEEAANATIAATNGSTLYDSPTATTDIVIGSAGTATATLTTALSGSNNDLVYTAVTSGSSGNDITIAYVNPGTVSASESVAVVGSAISFSLATDAGTPQVETAAVTGGGSGPTESGTLTVTVTGAAVTGSPVEVNVDIDHTVSTTFALVGADIRAALGAVAAITDVYTVGGTGANVVLTKTVAAANDATLNIAWEGSIAGITAVTSSTDTTAGVAPAITSTGDSLKATLLASSPASALVTAADAAGNDGSGAVTALSATNLTGGGTGALDEFYVALTDATTGGWTVRCGPPPIGAKMEGLFNASLTGAHAAP